jgi:predicted RNA-binding protein associated with RNAse of E/G family
MTGPDARPIADRFDIVEDVRLGEREVSYLDLLVDIWVAPDGTVLVEDEDEVEDHVRRGLLSTAQRQRIERTAALLKRQHRRIIREAARLLS